AFTGWPASNPIARTTPPASVVTSVPLTATKVPTASASSPQLAVVAAAALTAAAGCGMLSKNLFVCVPRIALTANTPPNTSEVPSSIRIRRSVNRGRRLSGTVGMEEALRRGCVGGREERGTTGRFEVLAAPALDRTVGRAPAP